MLVLLGQGTASQLRASEATLFAIHHVLRFGLGPRTALWGAASPTAPAQVSVGALRCWEEGRALSSGNRLPVPPARGPQALVWRLPAAFLDGSVLPRPSLWTDLVILKAWDRLSPVACCICWCVSEAARRKQASCGDGAQGLLGLERLPEALSGDSPGDAKADSDSGGGCSGEFSGEHSLWGDTSASASRCRTPGRPAVWPASVRPSRDPSCLC